MQWDTLPSADLDLVALRGFLDAAFDPPLSDVAFGHAVGGVHVVAREGAAVVGHAAVVQRWPTHRGRPLRCGYVEAVAVEPSHRRTGIGSLVMAEVERLIRGGYQLGALGASPVALDFYAGRGWRRWTGPLSAAFADGVRPTPNDAIFVLPVDVDLDLTAGLTADRRDDSGW